MTLKGKDKGKESAAERFLSSFECRGAAVLFRCRRAAADRALSTKTKTRALSATTTAPKLALAFPVGVKCKGAQTGMSTLLTTCASRRIARETNNAFRSNRERIVQRKKQVPRSSG
jgi:hypothetical protein